jgi:hypothetical protein
MLDGHADACQQPMAAPRHASRSRPIALIKQVRSQAKAPGNRPVEATRSARNRDRQDTAACLLADPSFGRIPPLPARAHVLRQHGDQVSLRISPAPNIWSRGISSEHACSSRETTTLPTSARLLLAGDHHPSDECSLAPRGRPPPFRQVLPCSSRETTTLPTSAPLLLAGPYPRSRGSSFASRGTVPASFSELVCSAGDGTCLIFGARVLREGRYLPHFRSSCAPRGTVPASLAVLECSSGIPTTLPARAHVLRQHSDQVSLRSSPAPNVWSRGISSECACSVRMPTSLPQRDGAPWAQHQPRSQEGPARECRTGPSMSH